MVPKKEKGKAIEIRKNKFKYKLDSSKTDDSSLWNAFLEGDDIAFEIIYKNYSALLYSYGLHICRQRELVEDCLHDLFVYIYQRRESLGQTSSIKFYLFRALRRKIVEELNKKDKFVEQDLTDRSSGEFINSLEAQLVELQNDNDLNTRLRRAVNGLSARQKEIVHLLYFSSLSHAEIASVMEIEIRTVYNQIHNALTFLKKIVTKSSLF